VLDDVVWHAGRDVCVACRRRGHGEGIKRDMNKIEVEEIGV